MILPELLGGFLFWLRGSAVFEELTGRGKTTGDAVWAFGMAAIAAAAGLTVWAWVPLAFAFWLGGRLPWWRSLTLGRNPNDSDVSVAEQWFRHAARGLLWTLPAATILGLFGYSWAGLLAIVGATAPIWWELGWRIYPARATEIGEAVFGAFIGGVTWYIIA